MPAPDDCAAKAGKPTMPRGAPLDDAGWRHVLARMPWLRALPPDVLARTRALVPGFLAAKHIHGAAGFEPSDEARLLIAVQACLPVNRLGLSWYDDFVGIVVYPDRFIVDREETDEFGIVHRRREPLAGEMMPGGPVVLSWQDVEESLHDDAPGYSVVIHEFAHKLDLVDGQADGCPPLRAPERRAWRAAIDDAFDTFCRSVDAFDEEHGIGDDDVDGEGDEGGEGNDDVEDDDGDGIDGPGDPDDDGHDPDGDAGPPWAQLALDPYAASDIAEFFAVASEAWFTSDAIHEHFPALARQFELLYG